jgi:hypothetical protein
MPGYLEAYGAGEEQRGKTLRWIVLAVVAAAALGGLLYFVFRNFSEDRVAKAFVAALQRKDFPGAYRYWGCSQEKPCRDYRYEKFLEDWGPQSPYADVSNIKIEHPQLNQGALGWVRNTLGVQYSCHDGVIYHLNFGKGAPVLIYVLRADKSIGFAPWSVCAPRIQL